MNYKQTARELKMTEEGLPKEMMDSFIWRSKDHWSCIEDKRKEMFREFRDSIKIVFDEMYAKINGERQSSSPIPTFPSFTPAATKHRSRLQKPPRTRKGGKKSATATPVVRVTRARARKAKGFATCQAQTPPSTSTPVTPPSHDSPTPTSGEHQAIISSSSPKFTTPSSALRFFNRGGNGLHLSQEEHRKRTGSGKVVTLQDLTPSPRNSARKAKAFATCQAQTPPSTSTPVTPPSHDSPTPTSGEHQAITSSSSPKFTTPSSQEEPRKRTGSGKVVTLQDLTPSPRNSARKHIIAASGLKMCNKLPFPCQKFMGGKRLRSVSMERLSMSDDSVKRKCSGVTSSNSEEKTILSRGAGVKSFIPTKCVKKQTQSKEAQQAKLAKKEETEARRREELEERRKMEIEKKKQRREERARKVAEKQAALKMQNELKNKNVGNGKLRVEELKRKKAKEVEEKNRKRKERMAAAEARRKQEEEAQKKKLQQMEDERRMAAGLAAMRREAEEDEKRQRRLEKHRQERERLMQHEAEMREKELELKRKLEEEDAAQRKLAEQRAGKGVGMTGEHALSRVNGVDLHKQLENLLAGTARVVLSESSSVKKTNQPSSFATDQESSSSKKFKFLQGFYNAVVTGKPDPNNSTAMKTKTTQFASDATPVGLNTTFIKEKSDRSMIVVTPDSGSAGSKDTGSYKMTPMDSLVECDNYDIDELGSEDSTDEEDNPKKAIPKWARPEYLKRVIARQEEALDQNKLNIENIFPPEQLLKDCDLTKIFKFKRRRFIQRSSSAQWTSPMIKQT